MKNGSYCNVLQMSCLAKTNNGLSGAVTIYVIYVYIHLCAYAEQQQLWGLWCDNDSYTKILEKDIELQPET